MGRRHQRLDKQESGGVHDISKRQTEMERAGVSFLGLRPSAMKMEKDKIMILFSEIGGATLEGAGSKH